MFVENTSLSLFRKGCIEVVCGSMFSGKTEELIRRLKRAKIAGMKVEIFKPAVDTRYDESKVVSHDKTAITSWPVKDSEDILKHAQHVDVVGIDEAQFFDKGIVKVCNTLANNGTRVIIAGLDKDYKGKPFGSMPELMAIAEYVTKVHAICMRCGDLAAFSYRKSEGKELVELGEANNYESLCRKCYNQAKRG